MKNYYWICVIKNIVVIFVALTQMTQNDKDEICFGACIEFGSTQCMFFI